MAEKVDYTPVATIVDALLAEGLHPSADRVRARLGQGSNETIGKLIKGRLRVLSRLPEEDQEENTRQPVSAASYSATNINPVMVATALEALRMETAIIRATAEAETFMHGRSRRAAHARPGGLGHTCRINPERRDHGGVDFDPQPSTPLPLPAGEGEITAPTPAAEVTLPSAPTPEGQPVDPYQPEWSQDQWQEQALSIGMGAGELNNHTLPLGRCTTPFASSRS